MSTRLNGLREKRGQILDKIEVLLDTAAKESRDLTDAEKTVLAELEKDDDRTKESLEIEERLQARKASQALPIAGQVRKANAAARRFRYGKIRNFSGPDAEEEAYRSGQWALAALFNRSSAHDFCRENGIAIKAAQSEGSNTAGGFLVPVEFSQAIIDLRESYGTFRVECAPTPMGSDSQTIPRRSGGLTAYWIGENSQMTESQKGWDQVTLVAKKLGVLTRYSTELSEDAVISIADDLAGEAAYALAIAEDAAGWKGDGTSAYGGIRGVQTKITDGTHTAGAVAALHNTFATLDAPDLEKVMAPLPAYARRNAKWYISQTGFDQTFQRLARSAGGNTIQTIAGKVQFSYLGYPIVLDQTLPLTTGNFTTGNVMLAFGDLRKAATLGERRGITMKTSEDRYFEFDQIGIQVTERVDIVIHDLGDNTTAGPINVLTSS